MLRRRHTDRATGSSAQACGVGWGGGTQHTAGEYPAILAPSIRSFRSIRFTRSIQSTHTGNTIRFRSAGQSLG
eukprot:1196166-Prorocentrum_minimum.AAC.4